MAGRVKAKAGGCESIVKPRVAAAETLPARSAMVAASCTGPSGSGEVGLHCAAAAPKTQLTGSAAPFLVIASVLVARSPPGSL